MTAGGALPGTADASALYACYRATVYSFCLRRLTNHEEASDAVQDTFLKAWIALDGGQEVRRPLPWLLTIARNVCIDRRRALEAEARALAAVGTRPGCPAMAPVGRARRLASGRAGPSGAAAASLRASGSARLLLRGDRRDARRVARLRRGAGPSVQTDRRRASGGCATSGRGGTSAAVHTAVGASGRRCRYGDWRDCGVHGDVRRRATGVLAR